MKTIIEKIKWLIARKEMEELYRRRLLSIEYLGWLSEFKDISLVLENLESESIGLQLDVGHPPGPKGPWDAHNLRNVLRRKAVERE